MIVRQVPLQAMLSPIFASDRIMGQDDIVSEVPWPPVVLESRLRSWDIAGGLH